jgi:hypothetical protein
MSFLQFPDQVFGYNIPHHPGAILRDAATMYALTGSGVVSQSSWENGLFASMLEA